MNDKKNEKKNLNNNIWHFGHVIYGVIVCFADESSNELKSTAVASHLRALLEISDVIYSDFSVALSCTAYVSKILVLYTQLS